MQRVFDNPNHPQYGPVRRTWVVLTQLDLLTAAERWSKHHMNWDSWVAQMLSDHPKMKESAVAKLLIAQLLEGWN